MAVVASFMICEHDPSDWSRTSARYLWFNADDGQNQDGIVRGAAEAWVSTTGYPYVRQINRVQGSSGDSYARYYIEEWDVRGVPRLHRTWDGDGPLDPGVLPFT